MASSTYFLRALASTTGSICCCSSWIGDTADSSEPVPYACFSFSACSEPKRSVRGLMVGDDVGDAG